LEYKLGQNKQRVVSLRRNATTQEYTARYINFTATCKSHKFDELVTKSFDYFPRQIPKNEN